MQEKTLKSGVSHQENRVSRRRKWSTVLHGAKDKKHEDRDLSTEVTGGLKGSRLGA